MQYTTNYNLGLVEGADLVNPMTQMNPNFTDLDSIIKAVADATITTATEVASGTVHGLTRANTDANVFKWVATANFNLGDTFTVDGVTVTALKTNGTNLQTGEYIIGSSVLGILDGTRLTVFVAQNISQTAADISYDNTGSGLTAADVQDAIDEVNNDLLNPPHTMGAGVDILTYTSNNKFTVPKNGYVMFRNSSTQAGYYIFDNQKVGSPVLQDMRWCVYVVKGMEIYADTQPPVYAEYRPLN